MRVVNIGSQRFTKVVSNDEQGPGNAYHQYSVETEPQTADSPVAVYAQVSFQKGGVGVVGVNGCHNEDLIAIVIDRLQCFQSSAFSCRENALALTKLEEALHWLNSRTKERQNRGVEGTHAV